MSETLIEWYIRASSYGPVVATSVLILILIVITYIHKAVWSFYGGVLDIFGSLRKTGKTRRHKRRHKSKEAQETVKKEMAIPPTLQIFKNLLNNQKLSLNESQPKKTSHSQDEIIPAGSSHSYYEELDSLVGLSDVKKQVRDVINQVKVDQHRRKHGMPVITMTNHLVFTGNPGTGKTTVARIVGGIYKDIGLLKKGHLIESSRPDFIGEYMGHTAIKTQEIIDQALDGILFIDEAYSLLHRHDDSFGKEAISEILRLMENYRDRIIVMIAGYPDEIEKFIDTNPGLKSRFKTTIHFPDYNVSELKDIFLSECKKSHYSLEKEAETALEERIKSIYENRSKGFGNGREMRNLFEDCYARQSTRLAAIKKPSKKDLATFTSEDIRFK